MRVWVVLPLLVCLSSDLSAQKPDPQKAIDTLVAQSKLESASTPWHLKLTVTPAKGEPVQIEEWYVSHQKNRTTIASGAYHQTRTVVGSELYLDGDTDPPPSQALKFLSLVHHPGPSQTDLDATKIEYSSEKLSTVKLDCALLNEILPPAKRMPINPAPTFPAGFFPSFCFDAGTQNLRLRYFTDGSTAMIVRAGTFQGNQVPIQISLFDASAKVAQSEITALEAIRTVNDDLFRATGKRAQPDIDHPVQVDRATVNTAQILKKVPPIYPSDARARHATGTVVMHMLLREDGTIQSLRIINPIDPDLAIESYRVVKQWKYKPYLQDGVPVPVDTEAFVNFSLD